MAYAYRQNRSTLGGLGYADAEAIESNAVNAGIKAGQNAVQSYGGTYDVWSEEDVFYNGFAEGYNSYMESINSKIFIGSSEARKKVIYKKTQPTPRETYQHEPEKAFDYGEGSAQYSGKDSMDFDLQLKAPTSSIADLYSDSGEATVTVIATGKTSTITTKKAGISPLMIALGAGAVLLVLLLKDRGK